MRFNGNDLSGYMVTVPSASILPPVATTAREVPGCDGSQHVSHRFTDRYIDVDFVLRDLGMDVFRTARAIAPLLVSDGPARLELDELPGLYYMAALDESTDLDSAWSSGSGTLRFRCFDPVAYGETRGLGGTTALRPEVGGTYRTWPVVRAVPAANTTYYRVTDYETGRYVQLTRSFNGSNAVVIDMEAMHCTVDGASADQYVTLASDYFSLAPGVRDIRASSGTTNIEWTERWL